MVKKQFKIKGQNFFALFFYILVLLKLSDDRLNLGICNDCLGLFMKLQAVYSNSNLLAVPVGIKQKQNVDAMVQKVFLMTAQIIQII